MSFEDDLVIVVRNVSQRKLRSWLTVLGVVIGVAAIIALVATSRGLEASIEEQFEAFGSDKINIFAASTAGGAPGFDASLSQEDVDVVSGISEYSLLVGMLSKSARVEFRGESVTVFATGFDSDKAVEVFGELNLGFREGSSFESDGKRVVIGPRIADELFERSLFVGNKLEIEGGRFEVVGILNPIGNPQDDSAVYMPLETMREVFKEDDSISFIFAKVRPGTDMDDIAEKTKRELGRIRSEESFEVVTPEQLLEQLGTILGIVQGVLVSIAAISLIVGSIGIASSMYTSVLERIRDIGIMKAVGATNSEITTIFLIEAGLLGLAGGIIGVVVGMGIAQLIGFGAAQAGYSVLKIEIDVMLMLFGLLFAVAVGAASGYLPARKAAKLKPVDALRK